MKFLLNSLFCFLLALSVNGQVLDLVSIDLNKLSNESKAQLKREFNDARIVILGEQTHGIGTEYNSFAQMVKFLHEELNFNVIIQEYCFYSTHLIDQQVQETWSAQEYRKTMYWPQGIAQEYNLLFNYLDLQKEIKTPIRLEGFDSRIANRKSIKTWIGKLVSGQPNYYNDSKKTAKLLTTINRVIDLEYRDTITSKTEKEEVLKFLDFLIDYNESILGTSREVQQIKSLRSFSKNAWNLEEYADDDIRRYHHRERQMANNLMWLIDSAYAGEKIIVHMHNGHAAKNIHLFQEYTNDPTGQLNITVGDIVFKKYGSNCKIIATTAYSGTHCKWDFKPIEIPSPHKESLEAKLHNKGLDNVYVNIEDYNKPFYLFFNEFNNWEKGREIKAPYGSMFDGIIFFDRVKAPTKLEP